MSTTIYDFQKDSNAADWQIVNDGVMGGMSQGNFKIDQDGNGVFYGDVSTENNGGFSSVRHEFAALKVDSDSKVVLTLKGDGKNYQFRIKDKLNNSHSYITTFSTNGDWQKIEISLKNLEPSFRGQKLNMPNFDKTSFEEIRFLIGNKKEESFKLSIDKIELF
ncbi:MAG: CIA30 family protein [Flavobacterium sp.]